MADRHTTPFMTFVLQDKNLYQRFWKFLESLALEYHLSFWEETENFKNLVNLCEEKEETRIKLLDEAQNIYQRYLRPQSKFPLSIPDSSHNTLTKQLGKKKLTADMFDQSQNAVFNFMETILVPKFLKATSQIYVQASQLQKEKEEVEKRLEAYIKLTSELEEKLRDKEIEIKTYQENIRLSKKDKEDRFAHTEDVEEVPEGSLDLSMPSFDNDPLLQRLNSATNILHEVLEDMDFSRKKLISQFQQSAPSPTPDPPQQQIQEKQQIQN